MGIYNRTVIQSAPGGMVPHRNAVAAADGAAKPAANNAAWLANPGTFQTARVFVSSTGTPTTCTLRPYVRSGSASGSVGSFAAQTLGGTPNYDVMFDVTAAGDDLLVFIETLTGGSGPTITVQVSWR